MNLMLNILLYFAQNIAALALAARHDAKCEDICHVAKDLWCL